MANNRAPKQWCLTKSETITSVENWKQNIIYTLSLDANFAPYLVEGATWRKKIKSDPLRGLANDGSTVPEARRKTAAQKVSILELMLGQIANLCPIISRNTIVRSSTSLECIWNAIRSHFGFQATGAHFIDFAEIHLQPLERPEDLYQRLTAFVEDCLLKSEGNLTHHNEGIDEDEELSPTLENIIVLTWLRLINPALPKLVKQPEMRERFQAVHEKYDIVFDPNITGYNGASGPFEARVNMGPVEPPQRKGRLPQYARDRLVELQQKFDDLEKLGVFQKPEDIGVTVEYLNPSFLVKKANGGSRLVTAFADVGRYSKPQPSLMPDVDSTLRQLGQWKHIIATDLTSAFYQIPLANVSMRYCGVVTPFRGVRVYTRSAMGMPGSETALEELMCRVLGDLLQEGIVTKIADDLYCGGNSPEDLLENWKRVLSSLYKNNLRLSASKTTVTPKSTTILGWTWSQGTLQANPHRISALASYTTSEKVKGLKSFIGAYKVLSRVLPGCSTTLSPLDDAVAGHQSQDIITWTDDLREAFDKAKAALSTNRCITLPRPDD